MLKCCCFVRWRRGGSGVVSFCVDVMHAGDVCISEEHTFPQLYPAPAHNSSGWLLCVYDNLLPSLLSSSSLVCPCCVLLPLPDTAAGCCWLANNLSFELIDSHSLSGSHAQQRGSESTFSTLVIVCVYLYDKYAAHALVVVATRR